MSERLPQDRESAIIGGAMQRAVSGSHGLGRHGSAVPVAGNANLDWKTYHNGGLDRSGRTISQIYAVDDDYVIYFSEHPFAEAFWDFFRRWLRKETRRAGWELFYETSKDPEGLAKADAALAGINRLLDDNQIKGSASSNFNYSTLELAGDALEMIFRDETAEGLEMLKGLRDKLQAKEEAKRRLYYQLGTLIIAMLPWVAYILAHGRRYPPGVWNPWMLGPALAMAGGLFSVCLNIASLEVNVNQLKKFLLTAGATRAMVAFLAGFGLLLAMRSKMFAGITYKGEPPGLAEALSVAEMFFCFLAGFSEYFVPNILRDSAKTSEEKRKPSPSSEKDDSERRQNASSAAKKKKTSPTSSDRHSGNAA